MLTFSVFLLQNDNRLITLRWCAHQGSCLLKEQVVTIWNYLWSFQNQETFNNLLKTFTYRCFVTIASERNQKHFSTLLQLHTFVQCIECMVWSKW